MAFDEHDSPYGPGNPGPIPGEGACGIEAVLAAHQLRETDPACSCGWDWNWREVVLPSTVDFDESRYRLPDVVRPEQHRAHVAAALRAHLLSGPVIEAAAEAHWAAWSLNDAERHGIDTPADHNRHMTRAALTAALDHEGGQP